MPASAVAYGASGDCTSIRKVAAIARWHLSLLNNEKMKNNERIVDALEDIVRQPYVVVNPPLSGDF